MPQSLVQIYVHLVFSTKDRRPFLREQSILERLHAYLVGVCKGQDCPSLQVGGVEDHVHLLLRIHPEFAISKTLQLLKANSSRWINENHKTRHPFQWQRGYGAFSVSQSMAETVRRYIERQKEHHTRMSFQEEYLEILRKHEIEFDLRYVFEEEIVA